MSFADRVNRIAAAVKDVAGDVYAAELVNAVRRDDPSGIAHWGALAIKAGVIDTRSATHVRAGQYALCAPSLWLAVYRGAHDAVELLLRHGASVNATSCRCAGGGFSCATGGQSALHVAVARGSPALVEQLLQLGALTDEPMCFGVDALDEPEWDEAAGAFTGGLVGLSALQLAVMRSSSSSQGASLIGSLLAHGAAPSQICFPGGKKALPMLRQLEDEGGEPLECPICLSAIAQITAEWTHCCCRAFHAHCLRAVDNGKCPMCRTPMRSQL
jgi:hypothetical protein